MIWSSISRRGFQISGMRNDSVWVAGEEKGRMMLGRSRWCLVGLRCYSLHLWRWCCGGGGSVQNSESIFDE